MFTFLAAYFSAGIFFFVGMYVGAIIDRRNNDRAWKEIEDELHKI